MPCKIMPLQPGQRPRPPAAVRGHPRLPQPEIPLQYRRTPGTPGAPAAKIGPGPPRFQVNLHQGLYCKLNTVMEMVLGVVRGAKDSQDARLLLQAGREFTRIINLMHKMAAQLEFDPEFLYCLMASDQWDLQEDALLPYAFQALSRTRQTLKVNLFEPCPEPEPQIPEPALNSKVKTLPPHRENKPDHQSLDHLSRPPPLRPGDRSRNCTRRSASLQTYATAARRSTTEPNASPFKPIKSIISITYAV